MRLILSATDIDSAAWLVALQTAFPQAEIHKLGHEPLGWEADYALVWKPKAELFKKHKNLKLLINLGAGVDAILKLAERPKHIPILKLREAGMGRWMSEYVMYALLHFRRHFHHYKQQQIQQQWQPDEASSIEHWSIGILGYGAIGKYVAEYFQTQGYHVNAWSRTPKQHEHIQCFAGTEQLHSFLQQSRVLVNLLPATTETYDLLNQERLAQLPDQALIINVGRGDTLDSNALLQALENKKLMGAVLDVFKQEPLKKDHPLWSHPNVLITPHIAAPTLIDQAVEQIKGYLNDFELGKRLPFINPESGY